MQLAAAIRKKIAIAPAQMSSFLRKRGKIGSETKKTKRRTIRPLSFLCHSQLRKEKRVDIGQLFNSLA